MDTLYTFWDNISHYKTESVNFEGLLNAATKILMEVGIISNNVLIIYTKNLPNEEGPFITHFGMLERCMKHRRVPNPLRTGS